MSLVSLLVTVISWWASHKLDICTFVVTTDANGDVDDLDNIGADGVGVVDNDGEDNDDEGNNDDDEGNNDDDEGNNDDDEDDEFVTSWPQPSCMARP